MLFPTLEQAATNQIKAVQCKAGGAETEILEKNRNESKALSINILSHLFGPFPLLCFLNKKYQFITLFEPEHQAGKVLFQYTGLQDQN